MSVFFWCAPFPGMAPAPIPLYNRISTHIAHTDPVFLPVFSFHGKGDFSLTD